MRNGQKGQAALEFLTTYGWAFLVILVMIGALAGFGILSPKNLLPNRCSIGPELACQEATVSDGGNVVFVVKNSLSDSVTFDSATLAFNNVDLSGSCSGAYPAGLSSAPPGGIMTVTCSYTSTETLPAEGDKTKLEVTLSYEITGKTLIQTVKGEIFQVVTA